MPLPSGIQQVVLLQYQILLCIDRKFFSIFVVIGDVCQEKKICLDLSK